MSYRDTGYALPADVIEQLRVFIRDHVDTKPLPGSDPGTRLTVLTVDQKMDVCRLVFPALPGIVGIATVIVAALQPMQQIPGHTDAYNNGQRRLHIPVQMNDKCWVFNAGEWAHLTLGHAYEMFPTQFHGAVNWGDTPRWHLILDVHP